LLQHAQNPVDWYPWCDEAFERAKKEDKPIFLSIGYSTCHWCHVMEKESFEDEEVAKILNENFVCVKVDREERPDLDALYMEACVAINGSGGWPLTIIMTPDKKPFFAATYIPKKSRFGMKGLLELLPEIAKLWKERRNEVLSVAEQVTRLLQSKPASAKKEPELSILYSAYNALYVEFDEGYAGFGVSPKFPIPHRLGFLLRYWKRRKERAALYMVEKTLQAMRQGGIYDQIGFGFHRYSTDRQWLVPHFEKMIYDQALLVYTYCEAYQATKNPLYAKTALETVEFVLREMRSKEGAFYTALDADSEGVEGKYYVWTLSEIEEVLPKDLAQLACSFFSVTKQGNFVLENEKSANVLSLSELGVLEHPLFEEIRKKLFEARQKRVRPSLDDKILTDMNGLVIAALSKASYTLDEPKLSDFAEECARFILEKMTTQEGGLYHRFKEEAGINALLDDYAFLCFGLLELYEATFKEAYLQTALDLVKFALNHFWDAQEGGFYTTADFEKEVLVRKKQVYDGAIPSGNSVMLLNLLRLSRLTASTELEEKAYELTKWGCGVISTHPEEATFFLQALDFALGPTKEVVVVGKKDNNTNTTLRRIAQLFSPRKTLLLKPIGEEESIERLAPFTKGMKMINDKPTIYVCTNFACDTPTTELESVLKVLEG